VLVEARERRNHFLRMAVRSLGLGNAHPLHGRAESLPPRRSAAVVAQAVAKPEVVLGWMARWALPGGLLALPQAHRVDPIPPSGVQALGWRAYQVPLGGPERVLWLGRLEEPEAVASPEIS
jgi:16S rRNA G527 N7-methylase RsmG